MLLSIILIDRAFPYLWLKLTAIKLKLIALVFCFAIILAILFIVSKFTFCIRLSYVAVTGGIIYLAYIIIELLIIEWGYGELFRQDRPWEINKSL
jgi:cell division septal protein FtsQ